MISRVPARSTSAVEGYSGQFSKVILFGEGPLLRVLAEYSRHYHSERNHQGKGNQLLFPRASPM